jgi:hypothetical protein
LFFVGGNDQQTAELARLRGELQALDQSQIASAAGFNSKDRRRPEHTCNDQNRPVGETGGNTLVAFDGIIDGNGNKLTVIGVTGLTSNDFILL